ncbi:hypothetical protein B0T17DRAFT_509612 [Bombardia bombarda]|uniref:Uncharacterized protein n=1 Tax=Bombardia bombarda TaxID=252184 RepID=A0AA40BYC3_9PEZI|nr:hypothetical protein B0T17DRAFT_509612 [Bombardia bombarda]
MAAPPSSTIGNLGGKWVMNKSQSSNVEPGLALQGVGWVTRKAVSLATVTLNIKQYTGPPSPPAEPSGPEVAHVEMEQTGTGGMKGTTEKRCLDNVFREHSDWLFGHVKGHSRWVDIGEVDDAFLKAGWLEGAEEAAGPNGETHLLSHVESLDLGWTATQIWGFKLVDGVRKYVRNIVIAKGAERVELQLVYDRLE